MIDARASVNLNTLILVGEEPKYWESVQLLLPPGTFDTSRIRATRVSGPALCKRAAGSPALWDATVRETLRYDRALHTALLLEGETRWDRLQRSLH